MIERVFGNKKTTIVGVTLLGLCFTAVFIGKATLTDVSVFMMGGFALFFAKDGKSKPKNQ